MKVLTLSVTEPGRRIAERLPYPAVHGQPAETLRRHWHDVDGFVVVMAVGATVRLLAPLLGDKASDPAVVCVDDAGRHAVVVCGSHARGGNHLATEVAGLLGCEPVVTTATDSLGVPALDQLPGMVAEAAPGALAAVSAALVNGQGVEIVNPIGWPLPAPLLALATTAPAPPRRGAAVRPRVLVTDLVRATDAEEAPTVALRPPSLVVGVGTASDATPADAAAALEGALDRGSLSRSSIGDVATIDRRAGHPAVRSLAEATGARLRSFAPSVLAAVAVPSPSERVRAAVGTPSVAEAAALAAGGPGATLVVPKTVSPRVTLAVARRAHPRGELTVVGLGPGGIGHRTPAAVAAVRHAEVVVGYHGYLRQCEDLLGPHQEVQGFELGEELDRAQAALAAAGAGRRVALVCSGDPGVYAMASPLLELAGSAGNVGGPEVTVVPGVTASLAAAALLGAPLGHDHAVVSLSDLHTPWSSIQARVEAAARADYVLVLYNPRSSRRTWQIERVKALLLEHRAPGTPVGLVTDATRPGERVLWTTLGDLPCDQVSMTTCVIVGASSTRLAGGRMVTPRGLQPPDGRRRMAPSREAQEVSP
ncbi:MAG TPA: precorrin-3B C(17)-methyltransferase [Acidimicrobiales bacterium]|nr:precorrin-3B C(17)-methyltransferase [Acidimicrobiales bacterium]